MHFYRSPFFHCCKVPEKTNIIRKKDFCGRGETRGFTLNLPVFLAVCLLYERTLGSQEHVAEKLLYFKMAKKKTVRTRGNAEGKKRQKGKITRRQKEGRMEGRRE